MIERETDVRCQLYNACVSALLDAVNSEGPVLFASEDMEACVVGVLAVMFTE